MIWGALGLVALVALIGFALWRGSAKATRGKAAQEKLDAVDEAQRIRHRLRTQPSFAERVREKFTR